MRTAMKVNQAILEASVAEAEKNGPLKNLVALWQATSAIYNKTTKGTITPSVVMLRCADWNIAYKTVAGKRGRPASTVTTTNGVVKKQAMDKVFVPLCDWQERQVEKGPFVTEERAVKERWVIFAYRLGWGVGLEDSVKGIIPVSKKYFPGFNGMFKSLPDMTGLPLAPVAALIVEKLTAAIGNKLVLDKKLPFFAYEAMLHKNAGKPAMSQGAQIDRTFNVNFCLNPDVYQLVFKEEAVEVEGSEEDVSTEE